MTEKPGPISGPAGSREELDRLLDSLGDLRPLPASTLRVIEISGDSRATVADLTSAIDPALASKLLRLANSAYYNHRGAIGSVRDAVLMLGFGAVRAAALASGVIAASDMGTFDPRRFWSYCVTLGEVAQLVSRTHARHRGEAFTAGVLHGIGRIAVAQQANEQLVVAATQAREQRISFEAVEEELFGFSDAALGEALAKRWDFPERLVESIALHGIQPHVQEDPTSLAADVERACALVRACGLSDGIAPLLPRAAREIDPDWFSPPLSTALRDAGGLPMLRDRANTFVAVALGDAEAAA